MRKTDTSNLQDLLTGKLITLASAKGRNTVKTDIAMEEGLFTTIQMLISTTNVKKPCAAKSTLLNDSAEPADGQTALEQR